MKTTNARVRGEKSEKDHDTHTPFIREVYILDKDTPRRFMMKDPLPVSCALLELSVIWIFEEIGAKDPPMC